MPSYPSQAQALAPVSKDRRIYPVISREAWVTALVFMLSLALTGLAFYPALLISLAMMVKSYRSNPYDFSIMALLFAGCYGLMNDAYTPVKPYDICLIAAVVLFFIFKKAPIIRNTLVAIVLYGALLFCLALFSDELLSIQLLTWRRYLTFVFFIIPIVAFRRHEFKFFDFWNRLMPYVLLACIFYIVDAFILCGNILMPGTAAYAQSTFYDPIAHPLSFHIFRKYPPGLFPMILLIYPVAKYYKLKVWQWVLVGLALLASQTFSVIGAFFLTYILFRNGVRRLLLVILIGIAGLGVGYFIDGLLPEVKKDEIIESSLRIKSSVDQTLELMDAVDDEDLAKFASGRMAQVLPRVEMVSDEGRQLTGLGFLHKDKNTVKRYEIVNEYYTDISENEEVVAEVEVIPVQIYISVGLIGLIVHCLFLYVLYRFIRRLAYNAYFLSVLFCCIIAGLAGFCGLINIHGLGVAAMAYSAVILANRTTLPGFPQTQPR